MLNLSVFPNLLNLIKIDETFKQVWDTKTCIRTNCTDPSTLYKQLQRMKKDSQTTISR